MGAIDAHYVLSAFTLDVDDIIVLAILTPLIYSYIQFFYLPPKQEPGYELFFVSPQVSYGLFKGRSRRDVRSRVLGDAISGAVSKAGRYLCNESSW